MTMVAKIFFTFPLLLVTIISKQYMTARMERTHPGFEDIQRSGEHIYVVVVVGMNVVGMNVLVG